MKMKGLDHKVTIVLFRVMSVLCIGRAERQGCFTTKEDGRDVHMHTTDVTNEFYDSRPHSPLRFSTEFKPLPEAPVNVMFSEMHSHQNTSLRWTQKQGFRSRLLRFFLMKMVKDKEIDGVPMRYTRYLLLGPVIKLTGNTPTTFSYSCVNLTGVYEVTINIWSLGTVNMSAIHKQFWINEFSHIEHHVKPSSRHHVQHSTEHEIKRDTEDSRSTRTDKAQSDESAHSKKHRKKKKGNRHQGTCL